MTYHKTMHDFTINDQWHGRFDLLWSYEAAHGQPRWRARFWDISEVDFCLIGRVVRDADVPLDYYLIPTREIGRGSWRASLDNGEVDTFRHRSLASVANFLMRGELFRKTRAGKQVLGPDHPKGGAPPKQITQAA
jgi:hypothetical protein